MLYCKKLDDRAQFPTVSHPGEDLGYDLYAIEDVILVKGKVQKVKTGISARYIDENGDRNFGLLYRDRSSLASKGITVSGGVIDAGYLGELVVLLTNHNNEDYVILAGNKVVQMVPVEVLTRNGVYQEWVDDLPESLRGINGFGSTGK